MATIERTINEKQRALLYRLCKLAKYRFTKVARNLLIAEGIYPKKDEDIWDLLLQVPNGPEFQTVIECLERRIKGWY